MSPDEMLVSLRHQDDREVHVRYRDVDVEGGIVDTYDVVELVGEGVTAALRFPDGRRISVYVVESVELPQWCCFDADPQTDPRSRYWDGPIRCSECGREWDGEQEAAFRGIRI
jgi:hypothetical protein